MHKMKINIIAILFCNILLNFSMSTDKDVLFALYVTLLFAKGKYFKTEMDIIWFYFQRNTFSLGKLRENSPRANVVCI